MLQVSRFLDIVIVSRICCEQITYCDKNLFHHGICQEIKENNFSFLRQGGILLINNAKNGVRIMNLKDAK